MITLDQWRQKISEAIDAPAMDTGGTVYKKPRRATSNPDFTYLKYFFDETGHTPSSNVFNIVQRKVEALKDMYVRDAGLRPGQGWDDIPVDEAEAFTVDLCAAALKVLVPEAASGSTLMTKKLQNYMGGEGDQFSYLKKVLGNSRVRTKPEIVSQFGPGINRLKRAFTRRLPNGNWNENLPEVKSFIMDVLSSILKAVFSAQQDSGAGRKANFNKMANIGQRQQKPMNPPTRLPEKAAQSQPEPPREMQV